jgi:putative transposase
VPAKQPKRRRLWLGARSCIRLRPTHRKHVWSHDFVMDRTADSRAFRMLTIVDEYTRECLAIDVSRKMTSEDVLERLSDLLVRRGVPDHVRSDNGSEFTAKRVREWLERVGVKMLYIEPGSLWKNGNLESVNGKLRVELLDREVFDAMVDAKVLIEGRTKAYDTIRPHSSLGYRPPATESRRPCPLGSASPHQADGGEPLVGHPIDRNWFHPWGQVMFRCGMPCLPGIGSGSGAWPRRPCFRKVGQASACQMRPQALDRLKTCPTSPTRMVSLAFVRADSLSSLCVVDLFNEGSGPPNQKSRSCSSSAAACGRRRASCGWR